MLEQLYGIEHGKGLEVAGIRISESSVKPSRELLENLFSLPKGTKVGIEYTPDYTSFQIDGISVNSSPTDDWYWKRIIRVCNTKGLDIVYLEDFPTYEKYARKLLESKALDLAIEQKWMKDRNFFNTEEGVELQNRFYIASVEADYIFIIEREEKILDRIAQAQPHTVILGKGHTNYLMQNLEELSNHGISVRKYYEEEVFIAPWSWNVEVPDDRARLKYNPKLNPDFLNFRESLKRKYRAIAEGKILPDGRPSLVGSWDPSCYARGLFEMYVNEGNFSGIIEDTLGTATFTGEITDEEVSFEKTYDRQKSGKEAFSDPIFYSGKRIGDHYEGTFQVPADRGKGRRFILRKVNPK